ncbi:SANT and BTB domain regulator of class switch recombination isoform X3 [Brachyistius frenatus]|uniref:SANT and BTB domain regulator of class switch recombination isoform X3 n=1 Tax=Brachyistius frenatus TaxID=100188 RepID=UPI0037E9826F
MSRFCSDNNNFPYDNNILVLDMVLGSLWGVPQPINWDNVAKLVPGFTPKECARRFEELKSAGGFPHVDNQCNDLTEGSTSPSDGLSTLLDAGEVVERGSSQSSSKVTGSKLTLAGRSGAVEKKERRVSAEEDDKPQKPRDPSMVIHVCDETKNLKQDFTCPRDLLVKEMRYFAEYLTVDAQRWEEVDISVHCDVQIFDWLMNYVRRNSVGGGIKDKPRLGGGVHPVLPQTHERHRGDSLQHELHQQQPGDTHRRALQPQRGRRHQGQKGQVQEQTVSEEDRASLRSEPPEQRFSGKRRRSLQVRSVLQAADQRHGEEDLLHSRENQRWCSWRDHLHTHEVFVCAELTHCKYHPDSVLYPGMGAEKGWHGAGMYPCCNQRVLRFDPTGMPKGCKIRDHIVNVPDEESCDEAALAHTGVLNDLLLHRDEVCVSNTPAAESTEEIPSSAERVQDCDVLLEPTLLGPLRADGCTFSLLKNWSLQLRQQSLLSEDEEYTTGSEVTEDEVGDEEELFRKQVAKKAKKVHRPLKKQMSSPNFQRREKAEKSQTRDNTPFIVSVQKSKWDSSRSMRYNQDAQREEDQRRMVEIVGHLTKMRFGDQEQSKSKDTKEPAGGIYSRLEAQFKSTPQARQSGEKTPRSEQRKGPDGGKRSR